MSFSSAMRVLVCGFVVVFAPLVMRAQPRNPAEADIRQNRRTSVMVSVHNLVDDPADCVLRHYSGTIIKVHHDEEYGIRIDGFTLLGSRGERNYFNVDQSIYDDFRLVRADIGWLPTLIAPNKKVRVDAYLCGASGGVAMAHNITSETLPAQTRQTRRRAQNRRANKSLDASGGSVFRNMTGPAMLE